MNSASVNNGVLAVTYFSLSVYDSLNQWSGNIVVLIFEAGANCFSNFNTSVKFSSSFLYLFL